MRVKSVVMDGVKKLYVREIEVGELWPGEVLVKVHSCNICTYDWETWLGLRGSQGRKFPFAPGHEEAGEVLGIGNGVPPEIKIGARVAISPFQGCGTCRLCRAGYTRRCNNGSEDTIEGVTGTYGMSQALKVDAKRVFVMNPTLPYEECGYLEPVASSVHALKRIRVNSEDYVIVIGAGNLGLVNAQVARAMGGQVLVSEINPDRCKIAESLGFVTVNPNERSVVDAVKEFTGGKMMSVAILAVGNTKANDQALQAVADKGRIMFFAAAYPLSELHLDPNTLHYRELELLGTRGADLIDCQIAADLLSTGRVKVASLLSHRVPIDEVERAFELASTPGTYRVSLVMW